MWFLNNFISWGSFLLFFVCMTLGVMQHKKLELQTRMLLVLILFIASLILIFIVSLILHATSVEAPQVPLA